MNTQTFDQFRSQSLRDLTAAEPEDITRRAKKAIDKRLSELTTLEQVLLLSDEEQDLLRSFRRFKLNIRRDGETFKWQTRRDAGVVIAEDTALISHPQEGAA